MKINKEMLSYLVFGILTTLVNIVSYSFLTKFVQMDYKLATTLAWFLSVIFAFFTNKIFVFNSKSLKVKTLAMEFLSFMFFRLLSYIIDMGTMIVMVEMVKINDIIAKVFSNILVIIINFYASKYFIFKSK